MDEQLSRQLAIDFIEVYASFPRNNAWVGAITQLNNKALKPNNAASTLGIEN